LELRMTPSRDISRLIEIMAALRTPKTGCPWDLEQDFATIANRKTLSGDLASRGSASPACLAFANGITVSSPKTGFHFSGSCSRVGAIQAWNCA
jgi:hypothetical protein